MGPESLERHVYALNAQLGSALLMLRIAHQSGHDANRAAALEAFWYEIELYYNKIAQYPFTCKSGCSACCFDNPHGVSGIELMRIFPLLSEKQKKQIAIYAQRYRELEYEDDAQRQLQWKALRQPCPLLEEGKCTVYAHRPLACRSFFSTKPAPWCDPSHKNYTRLIQIVGCVELPQLLKAFSEGSDIRLPEDLLCGLATLVEEQ